jgi:hypothetical protein
MAAKITAQISKSLAAATNALQLAIDGCFRHRLRHRRLSTDLRQTLNADEFTGSIKIVIATIQAVTDILTSGN